MPDFGGRRLQLVPSAKSALVGKDLPIRLEGGIDGSLDPGRRVCQKEVQGCGVGSVGFLPLLWLIPAETLRRDVLHNRVNVGSGGAELPLDLLSVLGSGR